MSNTLSARQKTILEVVKVQPGITKSEIVAKTGFSKDQVQTEVTNLSRERGNGTRYIYSEYFKAGRDSCWSAWGEPTTFEVIDEIFKKQTKPISYQDVMEISGLPERRVLLVMGDFIREGILYEVASCDELPVYRYAGPEISGIANYTQIPVEKCGYLVAAGHEPEDLRDMSFFFQGFHKLNQRLGGSNWSTMGGNAKNKF